MSDACFTDGGRVHLKPTPESVAIGLSRSKLDPTESWPSYLAWRRTKCRPFDREALMQQFKFSPDDPMGSGKSANDRMIEEIDQATHEFVGELAEIAELFLENGSGTFFGDIRTKLIDECGDAIFCGCWALDAWGQNPLSGLTPEAGVELVRFPDRDPNADEYQSEDYIPSIRDAIAECGTPEDLQGDAASLAFIRSFETIVIMLANAGLTSNSFKKLKFQRRDQDHGIQNYRVINAMSQVNVLLIMANSSMAEAMASNRKKLNARFPHGYVPGVGGGIRTGDGK